MKTQFQRFLTKQNITPEQILYIVRSDGKTVLHLNDGRTAETFSPLKDMPSQLAPLTMLSVNKGVLLNEKEIVSIDKGLYTMTDGATFRGRIRTPGAHNRNARLLNRMLPAPIYIPKNLVEHFSILDKLPLPFCVIEVVFDQNRRRVDYLIRYCNRAMAEFENRPMEEILNRSCFELFPTKDKKWAVAFADVALNGETRDISEERLGSTAITVHCFQPKEGYCACILVEK